MYFRIKSMFFILDKEDFNVNKDDPTYMEIEEDQAKQENNGNVLSIKCLTFSMYLIF